MGAEKLRTNHDNVDTFAARCRLQSMIRYVDTHIQTKVNKQGCRASEASFELGRFTLDHKPMPLCAMPVGSSAAVVQCVISVMKLLLVQPECSDNLPLKRLGDSRVSG
jgi:hypothetical protein